MASDNPTSDLDLHRLNTSTTDLAIAAQLLRSGSLVSFPTETVYGLGASIHKPEAIASIFELKGRPATDPLIVHVSRVSQAFSLWDASQLTPKRRLILEALASLWPAPLTLVAPAIPTRVPEKVTAGSGYVGIRIPAEPIALQILKLAGIPVAAPSANRFGHVSPTTAEHVAVDLGTERLWIVGDRNQSTRIGVESTVVKLEMKGDDEEELILLRRGLMSIDELEKALTNKRIQLIQDGDESVMEDGDWIGKIRLSIRDTRQQLSQTICNDGPGQLLSHYAPENFELRLLSANTLQAWTQDPSSLTLSGLRAVKCFLNIGDLLTPLASLFPSIPSVELECSGKWSVACHQLYGTLRELESEFTETAQSIVLVPYLSSFVKAADFDSAEATALLALEDRLYRSASGCLFEKAS